MIEKMIAEIKPFLPLKINTVEWRFDTTQLLMFGPEWGFGTFSDWRITYENLIVLGCNDLDSEQKVGMLEDLEIIELTYQDSILKVDPVFILSNGYKVEIFSTDTLEPWTFSIDNVCFYCASPGAPEFFSPDK